MKKFLFCVALITLSYATFAQEAIPVVAEDGSEIEFSKYGPYLTNKWSDNIFLGIGGGANLLVADHYAQTNFMDNVSGTYEITLGKWFTPKVGVRLQHHGLWAKTIGGDGGLLGPYYITGAKLANGLYNEKFSLGLYHFDFMYNISNAIAGYRSDRLWDFVPYVGFGFAHSNGENDANVSRQMLNTFASAGLLNNIRISDMIDITLDARYLATYTGLDGDYSKGFERWDNLFYLTAGIAINFEKNTFNRAAMPDYENYKSQISSLTRELANKESNLNSLKDANDKLAKDLKDCKDAPAVVVETKSIVAPSLFFFDLNKSKLSPKELAKFDMYVSSVLDAQPDKKFTVIGRADSATGTPKYNKKISEKRADYIVDLLIKKHGVDAANIEKIALGSTEDLYKNAELNRSVTIK